MISRCTIRPTLRSIAQYPRTAAPISIPHRGSTRISKPRRNLCLLIPPHASSRVTAHSGLLKSVQSSLSSTIAVLLLATAVSLVSYSELSQLQEGYQEVNSGSRGAREPDFQKEVIVMVGEPIPGRPDNLTAEEEQKLKEFWLALQAVCGVSPLLDGTENGSKANDAPDDSKEKEAEKHKKKKRLGLFSRGKDESEKPSTSAMDGEDKYGQAKDYVKVLENTKPEELREAVWSMVKHDNPDALLLRFLRARKWHVQNALIMMVATMHWRQQEQHVDDDIIYRGELGALEDSESSNAETKKSGNDFLMQMRLGKSFVHGQDKEGRPMCFVRVRLHHGADQSEKSIERYTVYTIETSRFLLRAPVDTAVCILNTFCR